MAGFLSSTFGPAVLLSVCFKVASRRGRPDDGGSRGADGTIGMLAGASSGTSSSLLPWRAALSPAPTAGVFGVDFSDAIGNELS